MSNLFAPVFLVLAAISLSSCFDHPNFTELTEIYLPDDAFEKIFATNNVYNELRAAEMEGIQEFQNILGVKLDPNTIQQLKEQSGRLLRQRKITPQAIFKAYTRTIQKSLMTVGVLKDDGSIFGLAGKFANALTKTAKTLSRNDSFIKTYPALISTTANYFKSLGLTSQYFSNLELKDFVSELRRI